MNALSFTFLAFGVIGAVVYNLIPSLLLRRLVLLALNFTFFAWFTSGPISAIPYALFLLVGYCAMMATWRRPSLPVFWAMLALVLLMFFWLKHYSFIQLWLTFPYIAIGLSYVFFRVLHLVIEARQGGLKEKLSPLDYLNYTLHFPALISGPIQFYPDYAKWEREEPLPLDIFTIGQAAWRVALGFFKVAIVSVLLMKGQHACIDALTPDMPILARAITSAAIWAIYPLFLYANFSGYTDFVIGIALLYRSKLPENFDNPFIAENFIAFWGRWHITLSTWLKTYVYMPVLMTCMRRWPSRKAEQWFGVLAYFITFFLVGAWHGQTSMFLFFGVLQGGGVAINKLYQNAMTNRLGRKEYRALGQKPLYRAVSRGLTFTWFGFTLLWFWSDWTQMGGFLAAAGLPTMLLGALIMWAIATVVLAGLTAATTGERPSPFASRYVRTAAATAMLLIVIISVTIVAGSAPDIVYKNF